MAGPIADEPVADETGKQVQSAGMLSCRANAMAAATAWAEADPLHVTGARSRSIRKWLVNEGNLQLSVSLCSQGISVS